MAIIPTIDEQTAIKEAKQYLLQYHDWQLIRARSLFVIGKPSSKQQQEHSQALYECNERIKIIDHIEHDKPLLGMILFYRFIKGYRMKRTIEELQTNYSERKIRYLQHEALLKAYEYIPGNATTIIKSK